MKKMLNILLIIFGVIVGLVVLGIILLQILASMPAVKKDYYNHVTATGEMEKRYTTFGKYETAFLEFDGTQDTVNQQNSFGKYRVWYPKELENSRNVYPVVVMANGTGVPSKKYEPIFLHLASWGFIVIGNNDESSWSGDSSSKCINFLIAANDDNKSIFYKKVNLSNVGMAGHSQGGVAAINAVTNFENSNIFTSLYTASATWSDLAVALQWSYDIEKVSIPYFFVAGTGKADAETISPLDAMQKAFDNMSSDCFTVMARHSNTDHGEMLANADGYMTAWFCYTLQGDKDAAKVFVGENPEILSNTQNWQDVKIKGKLEK